MDVHCESTIGQIKAEANKMLLMRMFLQLG